MHEYNEYIQNFMNTICAKTRNNPTNQYFQYKTLQKLHIKTRFIRKLTVFNRGNNWAVVTPIYKNCVPSCSLSHEEFKYFYIVSVL